MAEDAVPIGTSDHDRYLALRSLTDAERNFQNQAFTWFLGLNGFLFVPSASPGRKQPISSMSLVGLES
jgi:hypothetical protein